MSPIQKWTSEMNTHFLEKEIPQAYKYLKKCSASLVILEMQIKTALRYHLTPERMAFIKKLSNNKCGETVGKKEQFFTASGNADWYNHYGNQCGVSLKKLEMEIPFNPVIPLLGIYPKELKISYHSDICAPMFIAAQFVTGKSWK